MQRMEGKQMRGRRPKPSVLKQRNGSFDRHPERRNKNEPKPPAGRPACPDFLPEIAKQEWNRVCDVLQEMGILSLADGPLLELYCSTYARWREACDKINEQGMVVECKRSGFKKNPNMLVCDSAAIEIRKLLIEMGLTPSSRSRVSTNAITPKTQEHPDWAEFLRGGELA
jgi:P27 family predicted phage terminase small subunit